jgi:hypothetical protein
MVTEKTGAIEKQLGVIEDHYKKWHARIQKEKRKKQIYIKE